MCPGRPHQSKALVDPSEGDDLTDRRTAGRGSRSPDGRLAAPGRQPDTRDMGRKLSTLVALAVLLGAVMLAALSARNDYCLPWQERVGYGDGPLGVGEDFSACR